MMNKRDGGAWLEHEEKKSNQAIEEEKH